MLGYGEAHEFLKSLGFTFTYDNRGSFSFSDTHVFWQGMEFGVLHVHNMMFNKDGYVHQFSYNSFQPGQVFKDFVTDYITGLKQKFIEQKKKELEQDFVL